MKKDRKREGGQAMIEFILSLILTLSVTFFFIQFSLFLAYGNFVQYATFMAARAYLSAGPDACASDDQGGGAQDCDQRQRARRVIGTMLKRSESQLGSDRWPAIAKGVGGSDGIAMGLDMKPPSMFDGTNWDYVWLEGVRYTFTGKVLPIPMGRSRSGGAGTDNQVTLTSESWLGREPSQEECMRAMERFRKAGSKDRQRLVNNGC